MNQKTLWNNIAKEWNEFKKKPSKIVRGRDFKRKYNPKKESISPPQSETESVKGSSDETFPSIVTRDDRRASSGVLSSGVLSSGDSGKGTAGNSSGKISLTEDSLKGLIASGSVKMAEKQFREKSKQPIPIWVWIVAASAISALVTGTIMAILFALMS